MKVAIYPGSFDPITLGHLNIIQRAAQCFDKLVVCVMYNSAKSGIFSPEERVELIRRCVSDLDNVEVDSSAGLLADYAKMKNAITVVKGLRAVSDYENEVQMAMINRKLNPTLETMFLASSEAYTYLSSTVVKEMARYGADLREFVPKEILEDVKRKMQGCGEEPSLSEETSDTVADVANTETESVDVASTETESVDVANTEAESVDVAKAEVATTKEDTDEPAKATPKKGALAFAQKFFQQAKEVSTCEGHCMVERDSTLVLVQRLKKHYPRMLVLEDYLKNANYVPLTDGYCLVERDLVLDFLGKIAQGEDATLFENEK